VRGRVALAGELLAHLLGLRDPLIGQELVRQRSPLFVDDGWGTLPRRYRRDSSCRMPTATCLFLRGEGNFLVGRQRAHDEPADERGELVDGHRAAARAVEVAVEADDADHAASEQDRIVGVSGYAVRPPQVRREKPRVSAFISADIPKILKLEPDLVLAFSDLQADIVADLVRAGVDIHVFNQRDIAGIFAMIRTLGAIVDAAERADQLASDLEQRLARIAATPRPSPKPKVYFEEWDDPLISGIGWVSELIEIAGGGDALPKLRFQQAAKDRIIAPDVVREAAPDVILASWCGKKVVPDRIRQRPGWGDIPAVRDNRIVEIKSTIILQPGPAALTDGLDAIVKALWPEANS